MYLQVKMVSMYQQHYQQDPQHATPPIPSYIVHVPVPAEVLAEQCFTARYSEHQPAVAAEHIHATAMELLYAAYILEADPIAQQIQQSNQVMGSSPKQRYFLKRNLSGSFAVTVYRAICCCTVYYAAEMTSLTFTS